MALSTEQKVGLFFVIGLVVLGFLLEMGSLWNPFTKYHTYTTYLSSTTGLKMGDQVRLSGVEVGKITAIGIDGERVRVDFQVKPDTRIRKDSIATIRLTNLLGGQFLNLSFGSSQAEELPSGSTVTSRDTANIDEIVDNVGQLSKDAKMLVTDLNRNQNEVMGKISAMLDENRGGLRGTIANLDSITTKIDRGDGSLALLLNDKSLYNNANNLTASLTTISRKIERGEGTLGKLVNDDSIYNDARGAIASLNSGMKDVKDIAAKINGGQGTLGKLVNDDSLYVEVRDASKNIKEIAQKINSGQGTLGKLVNDDKLYYDTAATLKKTEKAMEGLGDTGPISVMGSIIGTLF